jgi:hypothetical protein
MMWRKLGCVVLCFLLSGCIYMGRDFSVAPVRTIENDVTTQKEIFGYLGNPLAKVWKTAMKPGLIPISLMSLASYVTSKNFRVFSIGTIQCVITPLIPDEPARSISVSPLIKAHLH